MPPSTPPGRRFWKGKVVSRAEKAAAQIAEQEQHRCHYCQFWAWSAFGQHEHEAPCTWPFAVRGLESAPKVKMPPGMEEKIQRPLMKFRDEGGECGVFLKAKGIPPMPAPPRQGESQ